MQWLIDIIHELSKNYIDAYFASHPPICCFHHLPCPPDPHWITFQLCASTAWITRDASSIVPEGTEAILLRIFGKAPVNNRRFQLRAMGDTLWHNQAILRIQVNTLELEMDKIVSLDSLLRFQTKVNSADWTALYMTVQGYFLGGDVISGFHNRGDPAADDFTQSDFPVYQSWTDLDLSSIIPSATSVILLRCRVWSGSNQRSLRFRTKGHSNSINISQCEAVEDGLNYYYDIQVPTNGLQTIQYWSSLGENAVVRMTVKGWWY